MGTGHSPADPGHAPRGHHEPRRPGRDHRLVQAAGVLTAGQDGSHQPRVAKTSAASSVNRSKFAWCRSARPITCSSWTPIQSKWSAPAITRSPAPTAAMTTPRTSTIPGWPACWSASPAGGRSWTSDAAAVFPSRVRWPRRGPPGGQGVPGENTSNTQTGRPRRLVPGAVFLCADATETDFPPGSFDAVVCLYALIHMPLDRQPLLLRDIVRWLRPGGWLLAVTGQDAWTGTEDNWLGGTAPMWWSQADAATYRTWLTQAGMEVTSQQFVPEGDGGHALFWARLKPADSPQAGTADGSSALASGAQANPQSTSAACRSQEPR